MSADSLSQLTSERRARLLAERKLDTRQADMRRDIAEMERSAARLTSEILKKRKELESVRADLERQLDETRNAQARMARAEEEKARSESRLWLALETVRDGFAMYDADARLTCANRAFLSIFDGLEEVAPGITYDRMCEILIEEGIVDPRMPPDDWLRRMRDRWRYDTIPDETICLWDGQFVKLVDRRLEGGGVVGLGLNQTYERRIASAIETIPDGFVVFDRDDNLVMCNRRYRDLFPGEPDVIRLGVNFEELLRSAAASGAFPVAAEEIDAWIEAQLRMHQSATAIPIEHPLEHGQWIRIVEAETPDGGRVGLHSDVTDNKRNEATLREAREAAEAGSRAKSQFLKTINHEFRTPLNGIIGLTSVLRDRTEDDGSWQLARAVEDSAQALRGIIENVLETVSNDTDYATPASAPFDLTETISHVVKLLAPKIHLAGIDLRLSYDDDVPIFFVGDDARLRQVLVNLVSNACKFAGGGVVTLRVEGLRQDAALWEIFIDVEDHGPGIPDGQSDRIFQPFAQAEDGHARPHDGMGLGLSLSRSVANTMGGSVVHDTSWTNGARFRLTLPLRSLPPKPIDEQGAPFLVLCENDLRGQLFARRLREAGFTFDVRSIAEMHELPVTDTVVIDGGTVPRALVTQLRHEGKRVIIVGQVDSLTLGGDEVTIVDASCGDWNALATALASQSEPRSRHVASPSPIRILAVEDNETNQLVLRKLLDSVACELEIVSSGAEAIARVKSETPDLIFMDISMPEMDGKTATSHIRAWQTKNGHPHIPIIALTAHAMERDRQTILAAGLDDILTKPLNRRDLKAAIDAFQDALRRKAGESGSESSGA